MSGLKRKREDKHLPGGEAGEDEEMSTVRAVFNTKRSKMLENLRNLESPLEKLQLKFGIVIQEFGRMWAAYQSHFGGVKEGDVDIEVEDIWKPLYQDIRGCKTVLNSKLDVFANRVAFQKQIVANIIIVVAKELAAELSLENLLILLDKLEKEVGVVECYVAARLNERKAEWEELQAVMWKIAEHLEKLKLLLQSAGYAYAQDE